jgi:hypothetical protein
MECPFFKFNNFNFVFKVCCFPEPVTRFYSIKKPGLNPPASQWRFSSTTRWLFSICFSYLHLMRTKNTYSMEYNPKIYSSINSYLPMDSAAFYYSFAPVHFPTVPVGHYILYRYRLVGGPGDQHFLVAPSLTMSMLITPKKTAWERRTLTETVSRYFLLQVFLHASSSLSTWIS